MGHYFNRRLLDFTAETNLVLSKWERNVRQLVRTKESVHNFLEYYTQMSRSLKENTAWYFTSQRMVHTGLGFWTFNDMVFEFFW